MNKKCCDTTCETSIHDFDKKVVKLVFIRLGLDGEEAIEEVFEWKAEGLGWEVPDHINPISSPERDETLLLDASSQAVGYSCVSLG